MANLLKLTSFGHAATNDVNKLENLAAAGLDRSAHVLNPSHAQQDVIDAGQRVESDVHKTAGWTEAHVVHRQFVHQTAGSGEVWQTIERQPVIVDPLNAVDHVIPWQDHPDVHTSVNYHA